MMLVIMAMEMIPVMSGPLVSKAVMYGYNWAETSTARPKTIGLAIL